MADKLKAMRWEMKHNLQQWIKEHPSLSKCLTTKCSCGTLTRGHKPYETKCSYGVEAQPCGLCGRPGVMFSIRKPGDPTGNLVKELFKLFRETGGER